MENYRHMQTSGDSTVYLDDNLDYHRTDGPAIEYSSVLFKAYYIHGVLTRLDGPAIISAAGNEYRINGAEYDQLEFFAITGCV